MDEPVARGCVSLCFGWWQALQFVNSWGSAALSLSLPHWSLQYWRHSYMKSHTNPDASVHFRGTWSQNGCAAILRMHMKGAQIWYLNVTQPWENQIRVTIRRRKSLWNVRFCTQMLSPIIHCSKSLTVSETNLNCVTPTVNWPCPVNWSKPTTGTHLRNEQIHGRLTIEVQKSQQNIEVGIYIQRQTLVISSSFQWDINEIWTNFSNQCSWLSHLKVVHQCFFYT